jgi:hypothetical protein
LVGPQTVLPQENEASRVSCTPRYV